MSAGGAAHKAGAMESLRGDVEGKTDGAVLLFRHFGGCSGMAQVVEAVCQPAVDGPVVVVHKGAVGIELRAAAFGDNDVVGVGEAVDGALLHVELNLEAVAADSIERCLCLRDEFPRFHRGKSGLQGGNGGAFRSRFQEQLFLCYDIAFWSPGEVFVLDKLDVEEVFAIVGKRAYVVVGQGDGDGFAWGDGDTSCAIVNLLPVACERPDGIKVHRLEVVLVESLDEASVQRDADGLVDAFHLVVLGLGRAVAEDDAVHHELAVVGRVAEVASIGKVTRTVGGVVV